MCHKSYKAHHASDGESQPASPANLDAGTSPGATTPTSTPPTPTGGSAAKRTASGDSKPPSPTHTPAGSPPSSPRATSPPATPSGITGLKRSSSGDIKTPSPPDSPRLSKRQRTASNDTTGVNTTTPPPTTTNHQPPAPAFPKDATTTTTTPQRTSRFASEPTPEGHLGEIPIDVLEDVFRQLPWGAALLLSLTNKYYKELVQPLQYKTNKERLDYLQHAQKTFPRHLITSEIKRSRSRGKKKGRKNLPPATPDAGGYACYTCMRVRPLRDFSEKQTTGVLGKGNSRERRRFCIPCGLKKDLYSTGAVVKRAGSDKTPLRRCKVCRDLKDGKFCTRCHLCQDCIGLSPDHKKTHCPACGKQDSLRGEYRPAPPEAKGSGEKSGQGAAVEPPSPDRDGGKKRRSA
ncbi:MAG: hypothetical protein M1831_001241 [Alyxoria varia]|nr:MAG: hypothetical protein M1831_001241 [Alyxoria varia]